MLQLKASRFHSHKSYTNTLITIIINFNFIIIKKKQLLLTMVYSILFGIYGFSQNYLSINPTITDLKTEKSIVKEYEENLQTTKLNSSLIKKEKKRAIFVEPKTETCFLGFVTIRYTVVWDDGSTLVEGSAYYCGCSCN